MSMGWIYFAKKKYLKHKMLCKYLIYSAKKNYP